MQGINVEINYVNIKLHYKINGIYWDLVKIERKMGDEFG